MDMKTFFYSFFKVHVCGGVLCGGRHLVVWVCAHVCACVEARGQMLCVNLLALSIFSFLNEGLLVNVNFANLERLASQ